MRLAAAMLTGDTKLILETCKSWFQASPLDTQDWERIFKAYEKVGEGEKRAEFLKSIRVLAVYFLDEHQVERIKNLL
jgi:DNA-binding SARP family transcriptional activator